MNEMFLITRVAGQEVAFPAGQVESVVNVGDIVPIPGAPPFVVGLFALRSRVLTLVDTAFHVTGENSPLAAGMTAIVVQLDGNSYGLVVDQVIDVHVVKGGTQPLGGNIAPGWRSITGSMVNVEGRAMLVADPAPVVTHRDSMAA